MKPQPTPITRTVIDPVDMFLQSLLNDKAVDPGYKAVFKHETPCKSNNNSIIYDKDKEYKEGM